MMYKPQEIEAEEILTAAGFSYDARASAGWVRYFPIHRLIPVLDKNTCVKFRPYRKKQKHGKDDRLHALVRDGIIHLHYDRSEGTKHFSVKNSNLVKSCILEFQKLDHAKKEILTVA